MTKISQLSSIGDSLAIGDQFLIRDIDDAGSPNKSVTVSGITRALADGDATAPALAFAADKNTGIYRVGTDSLAVATNGTGRLFVDANGNVGVGVTPDVPLTVSNATVGLLATFNSNNANGGYITGKSSGVTIWDIGTAKQAFNTGTSTDVGINTRTGYLALGTANAERLRITAAGLVGIGVTSPGSALEINAAAATSPFIAKINTSEAARIDSSGRLLVGTSSGLVVGEAQHLFQVESVSATPHGGSFVRHGGTSAGAGAVITLGRSRGTSAGAVTAVADGDTLGYLVFSGSNGSDFSNTAAWIQCQVDGVPFSSGDTTDLPGRLVFSVTADAAATPTERMRITNGGGSQFFCASDTDPINAATAAAAGTSRWLYLGYYGATTVNTGTQSFGVYTNGNVINTNNSYGAISDAKLKENIVDATSQWSDIKALQVRKYNFKEGQTHTQIGLVAQETELVSPGLVSESPDRDAEGNDLGTVTKSVNYSVLYMKAVKALQEAMERIEALEADVALLKGE